METQQVTRRREAVEAWRRWCERFLVPPRKIIGCTFPGFEDFRVDAKMADEIKAALRE